MKKTGKIQVTVQREDRLFAINKLASAIEVLARALNAAPRVDISDCHIEAKDIGIQVDTVDIVETTEIKEL